MLRVFLFSVFGLPFAFLTTMAAAEPEVHVVSIYEPQIRKGEGFVAPEVAVRLDRPGVEVRLVLGSYVPARWQISTTEATKLIEVVLLGHGAKRGEVLVDGAAFAKVSRTGPQLPLSMEHPEFRQLVALSRTAFGVEKLTRFQAAYTAPDEGFAITEGQDDNPLFTENYLAAALADLSEVPKGLRRFLAPAEVAEDMVETIRFSADGFVVTAADGATQHYPSTLDVPEISWVMGTARDPETGKLFGVTLGGIGYLYSFDPQTGKWAVETDMNGNDASGMLFDPAGNRLVIVLSGMVSFDGPSILFYGMDGTKTNMALDLGEFPGIYDVADRANGLDPALVPLGIEDGFILLQAVDGLSRMPAGLTGRAPPTRHYLVNLETGSVKLVSFDEGRQGSITEW